MSDGRAGGSRVRTVFIGSGGFGVEALQRLAGDADIELVGIVTAPPRPAGRRQAVTPTPIEAAARDLDVATVLKPERLRAPEAVDAVVALGPDLVVLADYGQIVPAGLLGRRHGALNLHPSLLPRYRGATPVPAAILAGDAETGVTLMRMDAGLDTGPIVAQDRVPLDGTETSPVLEQRLSAIAGDLLARSVGPWVRGDLAATPQDDAAATLTRPLRREDGRLDPTRPAVELERQVRAYQPWPGSFLETPVGRVTVWASSVLPGRPADRAGTLTDDDGTGLAIATVDGRLRLDEVQPAGGRRMDGPSWRRGLRPSKVILGRLLGRVSIDP